MGENFSPHRLDFSAIPDALKDLPQWVCWYFAERDGKKTKIPYSPKINNNAKSNDPATWGTFDEAYNFANTQGLFTGKNQKNTHGGIGFMFANGYCGIDLDHVIDEKRTLKDFAAEIVAAMDTYTELSPSGTGLHILFRLTKPLSEIGDRRKIKVDDSSDVEIYDKGRFFTVTGRPYGAVKPCEERTEALKIVYNRYFPAKKPAKERKSVDRSKHNDALNISTDHRAMWEKIFNSKNGAKYEDLYNGDISAYNGDDSSADLAMCDCLAWWTHGNSREIDSMFRETGLMRQKWDEMRGSKTYGELTIDKAIESYKAQEVHTEKRGFSVFDKRDAFLEGRTLLFHGSVRGGDWFSYSQEKGYWVNLTDADIQADVSNHFGHREKTRSVTDIVTQCRFVVTEQVRPKFNTAPLMSFQNGVLELNTGNFRPAKSDDFLTWQVGYNYNPAATCESFDLFIQQISSGEQSRVHFLDDIGGYVMFPDCRLEKCFFLIGNGGNGKSVYLNVLDFIFSSVNPQANSQSVTHIQPKDFKDPTKVIMLENSIVNIAYDIKPDLKGTEDTFKSLVSGEAVTGNLKFHDTHSFTNRAKLIASSNSMPIFDDNSAGLERRAMFVKLEKRFSQPDTGLRRKLLAEASGIFNRFYRAYRSLLERESTRDGQIIRPSCDQDECLRDFKIAANAILEFWEAKSNDIINTASTHENVGITKQEVYDIYCEWCKKTKTIPEQYNSFNRKFQSTLRSQGISFQSVKSNGYKGSNGGSYKFGSNEVEIPF